MRFDDVKDGGMDVNPANGVVGGQATQRTGSRCRKPPPRKTPQLSMFPKLRKDAPVVVLSSAFQAPVQ